MKPDNIAGIVTGGSSGLGKAVAQHLADLGAKVLLIDVNDEKLSETSALIGKSAISIVADIRDPVAVATGLDLCESEFGDIRFVVNCAGVPSSAKIVSKGIAHDYELWRRIIDVNLTGTFNVMRLSSERMIKNSPDTETGERGVIINTSSVAAFDGQRGHAAYAASKAGVVGLSLPVARELEEFGVRCVAIAPGLFETPIFDSIPEKGIAALKGSLLFPNRLGAPEEFAALVGHVISNPYINATCLRIDGGARLR